MSGNSSNAHIFFCVINPKVFYTYLELTLKIFNFQKKGPALAFMKIISVPLRMRHAISIYATALWYNTGLIITKQIAIYNPTG